MTDRVDVMIVGFGRTGSFYLPQEIVKLVLSMDMYCVG